MECKTFEGYLDGVPIIKNKKSYNSLDDAIEVAKKMNSYPDTKYKVVSYKCSECFKYHIGRNGKVLKDKEKKKLNQLLMLTKKK